MIADMIAGALLLAAFGCIIVLVLRHRFGTHLGALEAELRKPCPAQSPRSDLPAGTGGLEVMLLGAFPIARMIGGAAANQGEVLRYLAELPWCPDAILANRSLDWTVLDAKTIKVATGAGTARGEVTFELDEDGLIARASAPSRIYAEANGRTSERPWRGRFWDYQRTRGRLMPMQGEVAWALDAGDFIYWRGRILDWRAGQASQGARPEQQV